MYVDKSALSQYQTDNYLYLDKYDSNYDIGTTYTDGGSEAVSYTHLRAHETLRYRGWGGGGGEK